MKNASNLEVEFNLATTISKGVISSTVTFDPRGDICRFVKELFFYKPTYLPFLGQHLITPFSS
jgi:hypothetical protein